MRIDISIFIRPMTTIFGRMVTYLNGLLPINSHDPLITWPCEITWQTKTIISQLPQCQCPPNLTRWWLTRWAPTHNVTRLFGLVVFRDHMTNWNHYISNTTMPMSDKFGRLVTDLEGLVRIMLPDPFVTWSCKIMWQTKTIISPPPQCLWLLNMAGWWLT